MAALQTLSLQAVVEALTAAGVAGEQIDKDSLPPKIADDVVRFASENGCLTDALLVSVLDSGGLHALPLSNASLAVTDASLMKATQKHCSSFESIEVRLQLHALLICQECKILTYDTIGHNHWNNVVNDNAAVCTHHVRLAGALSWKQLPQCLTG
jgi:hypothetical protein